MGNRHYVRFGARRPVHFSGAGTEGEGQLINISLGGCAIESAVSVTTGAFLKLEVKISEQETPMLVALAPVRWSNAGRFGTEFIAIDREPQHQLHQFLAALKTGAPPSPPTTT